MLCEVQQTRATDPENTGVSESRFARFRRVSAVSRLQDVCSDDPKRLQNVCRRSAEHPRRATVVAMPWTIASTVVPYAGVGWFFPLVPFSARFLALVCAQPLMMSVAAMPRTYKMNPCPTPVQKVHLLAFLMSFPDDDQLLADGGTHVLDGEGLLRLRRGSER
jgi:hypothetical protein